MRRATSTIAVSRVGELCARRKRSNMRTIFYFLLSTPQRQHKATDKCHNKFRVRGIFRITARPRRRRSVGQRREMTQMLVGAAKQAIQNEQLPVVMADRIFVGDAVAAMQLHTGTGSPLGRSADHDLGGRDRRSITPRRNRHRGAWTLSWNASSAITPLPPAPRRQAEARPPSRLTNGTM